MLRTASSIDNDPGTSSVNDFLPHFKAIGQTLKNKRIFRKPNLGEAAEQYETLALELKRDEQYEYAAMCLTEASKCQEGPSNQIEKANLLVKSAKMYLTTHKNDEPFLAFEKKTELVRSTAMDMAVNHLECASDIYFNQGMHGLALIVRMEAGSILYDEEKYGDALRHFKSALDACRTFFSYPDQLVIIEKVVACKVRLMDYENALEFVQDALIQLQKNGRDMMTQQLLFHFMTSFDITRVCIILILGSSTTDLLKFIWPNERMSSKLKDSSEYLMVVNRGLISREEVQYLLKSLVLAVEYTSLEEIHTIRDELYCMLSDCHQQLFDHLINMYTCLRV